MMELAFILIGVAAMKFGGLAAVIIVGLFYVMAEFIRSRAWKDEEPPR